MDFSDDGSQCWPTDISNTALGTIQGLDTVAWAITLGNANANYGRTPGLGSFRERVKRRVAENEGIFLLRNFSLGIPVGLDPGFDIVVQSNAWIQMALRRR